MSLFNRFNTHEEELLIKNQEESIGTYLCISRTPGRRGPLHWACPLRSGVREGRVPSSWRKIEGKIFLARRGIAAVAGDTHSNFDPKIYESFYL